MEDVKATGQGDPVPHGRDDSELFQLGWRRVLPGFREWGGWLSRQDGEKQAPRPPHCLHVVSWQYLLPAVISTSRPWPPGPGTLVGLEGRWQFLV